MKTNDLFKPGKLTTVMDGGAGSSGKGKMASYITENAGNFTFACNAFAPQAGHWVRLDDGRQYFYQSLNSCAYNVDRYEKMYLGPGGTIELSALLNEIEHNKVPPRKLGISPLALILEDSDAAYERGQAGFDNSPLLSTDTGTMKTGSTCHGVGSAAARRVLRRASVRTARDITALQQYLCDVPGEIAARLDRGESGLLELAQGFQLSLLYDRFFPNTTSRQVTVAQGLSDMFLPTVYAGPVVINLRTYPIRINSNKYISEDGKHLTKAEVDAGMPHTVFRGDSGGWYPDQAEITWEELTKTSGSPVSIQEITSVTRLSRRIATFSRMNVDEAIKFNDTGHGVHLSLNFANYVDHGMSGCTTSDGITDKFKTWVDTNLSTRHKSLLRLIGTGAKTSETICL
jgi:Adenylosuccinate synthetase